MQATAAHSATEVNEFLSWEEICARYPDEWVVLVDIVYGRGGIEGARVYGHSPDRQAHRRFFRAAIEEKRGPMSRWTGRAGDPRWKWARVLLPD